jgi:hypothetical protein
MVPSNLESTLNRDDPPMVDSGMISVELDGKGRLSRFVAVPPQVSEAKAPSPVPNWGSLFAAAGIDAARFHAAQPKWLAPVPFDSRAAWDGSLAEDPNVPIRAEAAAFQGKPVYFELFGPWSRPERMQETQTTSGRKIGNAVRFAVIVLIFCVGGLIARRNLRLGRGDRTGATRAAATLFGLLLAAWTLTAHHIADVMPKGIAEGALASLLFAIMYLALEPYVRRRWPGVLISWNRVLGGRFRDPLVGRDLLAGLLAGAAVVAISHFVDALPAWVNVSALTPVFPDTPRLRGIAPLFGQILGSTIGGIEGAFIHLFVLFAVFVVVRRRWLAIAVGGVVLVLARLPLENYAIELPATALIVTILLFVLFRFGILSLVAVLFTVQALLFNPFTLDPSLWYFGLGMFSVAVVLGLAIYGFSTSLGGQKAFGALSLEE